MDQAGPSRSRHPTPADNVDVEMDTSNPKPKASKFQIRTEQQATVLVKYAHCPDGIQLSRSEDDRKFYCLLCDKGYSDPCSMQKHALSHSNTNADKKTQRHASKKSTASISTASSARRHISQLVAPKPPPTSSSTAVPPSSTRQSTQSVPPRSRPTLSSTPSASAGSQQRRPVSELVVRRPNPTSSRPPDQWKPTSMLPPPSSRPVQQAVGSAASISVASSPRPTASSSAFVTSSSRASTAARSDLTPIISGMSSSEPQAKTGTSSAPVASSLKPFTSLPPSFPAGSEPAPRRTLSRQDPPTPRPPSSVNIKGEEVEDEISIPADWIGKIIDLSNDEEVFDYESTIPPPLDESSYLRTPDEYTIISDQRFNLQALGLAINTLLKCVICLDCSRAVEPRGLCNHITRHNSYVQVPATLPEDLEKAFGLVSLKDVSYPGTPISPVFGVRLINEPLHFCGACHRGYLEPSSLNSHQSDMSRCNVRRQDRSRYVRYGQAITGGSDKRYFPIDISGLLRRKDVQPPNYSLVFGETHPPQVDFSKLPMKNVEDEQNLSQFLYRESWQLYVDGYTADEIVEACRHPDPKTEAWGVVLQKSATRYLETIQLLIPQHQTFGFLKKLVQISPTGESNHHHFNHIMPGSVDKYAKLLARLLFTVLRHIDTTWTSAVYYPPLAEHQENILRALRSTLDTGKEEQIDALFHEACFTLFAHERHQYPTSASLDKFFSPVNSFVVYTAVRPTGNFDKASKITQKFAGLEYSIRSTMMIEAMYISDAENIKVQDALKKLEPYIQDGNETPMAFIYNTHRLLATIRSSEINPESFTFTDAHGRSLSYKGEEIHLADIKRMVDGELAKYLSFVREKLFFGEDIPSECLPQFEIGDLKDNLQNFATGYSFIDDPRNGFAKYREAYGRWLLSDPERAEKYVYIHNGQLCWRPLQSLSLLRDMQKSRHILAPQVAASPGPMVRGSEFARSLFRNVPGASRNLRILYHLLVIIAIQDKTTHRLLKDLSVPHAPTREWAMELIFMLVIFRPFEEHLVGILLDDEAVYRYRFHLWPELKQTMSSDTFNSLVGAVTKKYLGTEFTPLLWRGLVTAFGQYLPDRKAFELHNEYFLDTAMMHTTDMRILRYGRTNRDAPGTDFRATIGCIQVCLDWHQHVNIGQSRPFKMSTRDDAVASPGIRQRGSMAEITPQMIDDITRGVVRDVATSLEDRVKETIMECMAEMLVRYFPKPPRPLDDNRLRPVSDISVHPSRLRDLREFLRNPNANFSCPEQAILLELMIEGKQSVLGVLGTGTGKTMIILMHAKMYGHGRVTVVVLPLSGLHGDFERRAQAFGILTARWLPNGKFNPNVAIVYVSIEHLKFEQFQIYLQELEHAKNLHIIVFDEIHKVLTDKKYRDSFLDFWVLNLVKTIIIGLTGTLPPDRLPEFVELTKTTWRLIRTPSFRREIGYEVRQVSGGDIATAIAADVETFTSTYTHNDRLMVFCRSHNDAEILGRVLKLPHYTSGTTDDNATTMEKWMKGHPKVMVSTSILGCGLDYPSVRHVIHWDLAYSMLDQHQQESRGGRDGQPCKAITYVPKGRRRPLNFGDGDALGASELQSWATSDDQCLRIIPSLYLDGIAVTCLLLPGCVLCSFCQAQLNTEPPFQPQSLPLSSTKDTPVPKRRSIRDVVQRQLSLDALMASNPIPDSPSILPSSDSPMSTTIHAPISTPILSSPSSKRQSSEEYQPNKRARLSEGSSSSAFVSPNERRVAKAQDHPSSSKSKPGLNARVDRVVGRENKDRFLNEVRKPFEKAYGKLRNGCILCLLQGSTRWNLHDHDTCTQRTGSFGSDPRFQVFKKGFRFISGHCFECGLQQASFSHDFLHGPPSRSEPCRDRGHLIRLLFAFLWLDLDILKHYPHAPPDLPSYRDNLADFNQWAMERVPGHPYDKSYSKMYDLFLWTMRKVEIVP